MGNEGELEIRGFTKDRGLTKGSGVTKIGPSALSLRVEVEARFTSIVFCIASGAPKHSCGVNLV